MSGLLFVLPFLPLIGGVILWFQCPKGNYYAAFSGALFAISFVLSAYAFYAEFVYLVHHDPGMRDSWIDNSSLWPFLVVIAAVAIGLFIKGFFVRLRKAKLFLRTFGVTAVAFTATLYLLHLI